MHNLCWMDISDVIAVDAEQSSVEPTVGLACRMMAHSRGRATMHDCRERKRLLIWSFVLCDTNGELDTGTQHHSPFLIRLLQYASSTRPG